MIELDELLDQILPLASTTSRVVEQVALQDAFNRVLALNVVSDADVPPHHNSAMDGYAVRCADFIGHSSFIFPVSQRISAGSPAAPLVSGTVARIFTGSMLPKGADAIVMQEEVAVLDNGGVQFSEVPALNQWIRQAGEDITKGQVLLHAGELLDAFSIGLLASIGVAQVSVFKALKVGVFVTGSELQNPGEALREGQIYSSNGFVWDGLLQGQHVQVKSLGIVPDSFDETCKALENLADCDLVISSGGVSVGEEDHVKAAVEKLGELRAWKVKMKPGKPLAFGHLRKNNGNPCWFFGLPGNPVSCSVAFLLVVKPFLNALQGRLLPIVDWRLKVHSVQADFDWLKPDSRREEFLRVRVHNGIAHLFANQSSGVLTSMSKSNALVRLPQSHVVRKGEAVQMVSFQDLLA